MWSDKESKIDFLNFNETAESIKDLITEKELIPISIGVFGDWGAGKSTILELTKASLDSDDQEYIQVHFDAWTFQGYDDAKAALLETIASTLVKKAADELDAHVAEIIKWHFSPETGCPFWLDWAKL